MRGPLSPRAASSEEPKPPACDAQRTLHYCSVMSETDTEPECVRCGATDAPEHGVIVGIANDEVNTTECTLYRADELKELTVLSDREADVAAHKEITGAPHTKIADRLDLSKSTVDEYSRRLQAKVKEAKQTISYLSPEVTPERHTVEELDRFDK